MTNTSLHKGGKKITKATAKKMAKTMAKKMIASIVKNMVRKTSKKTAKKRIKTGTLVLKNETLVINPEVGKEYYVLFEKINRQPGVSGQIIGTFRGEKMVNGERFLTFGSLRELPNSELDTGMSVELDANLEALYRGEPIPFQIIPERSYSELEVKVYSFLDDTKVVNKEE
jgi:hypothetical protein